MDVSVLLKIGVLERAEDGSVVFPYDAVHVAGESGLGVNSESRSWRRACVKWVERGLDRLLNLC